jgi:hypothetical protein
MRAQRLIAAASKRKIMLKKERENNKGLLKACPYLNSTLFAFAPIPSNDVIG